MSEKKIKTSFYVTQPHQSIPFSFRYQVKHSVWKHWTGSWLLLTRRSGSPVCGYAAFRLLINVSAGDGESETAGWNCESDTLIALCLFALTLPVFGGGKRGNNIPVKSFFF